MPHRVRSNGPPRARVLGRFPWTEQLESDVARSGILELLLLEHPPDAMLVSLDGNRTVAWLCPSGKIAILTPTTTPRTRRTHGLS